MASASVTIMRASMRLMKRAQVAPAKPPPTTTTRTPPPCAMAGAAPALAASAPALLRKSRRRMSVLLCRIPLGNGFDLLVRKTAGDAVHDGCRQRSRFEVLHG